MTEYQLFIEKLRSNIQASVFIGRFVKLRKHGKEFHGLCPFHTEKTPSFTVNDDKRFYHCFGCSAHGDIITFLMEIKRLGFKEAVEFLAQETGTPLPKFSQSTTSSTENNHIDTLYSINHDACEWFKKLQSTSESTKKYLISRGINEASITKFQIGYSPSISHSLRDFLLQQKYTEQEIIKAGLLIKTDQGSSYDRFRNRIIFPIWDNKNKVIAFGGRILQGTQAKYINSSESPIFNKSETLYAESIAKEAAYKKNRIVLVEGYIDVIMMHQIGFHETVATLGTAVTAMHLQKLWRLSRNPIIFLDNDSAGKKAMLKIAELALENIKSGLTLSFVLSNSDKDPADLCNHSNYKEIDLLLNNATPLSTVLWLAQKNYAIINNIPEEIAFLESNLDNLLNKIQDKKIKENFRLFFKNKIWDELRKSNKYKLSSTNSGKKNLLMTPNLSLIERLELSLIGLIINMPSLLQNYETLEIFSSYQFVNQKLQKISCSLIEIFSSDTIYLESALPKKSLYALLQNKITDAEINWLYNDSDFYIDQTMIKTIEKSLIFFNIIVKKIELINLQQEYEVFLKEFTEASINKAKLIFNEIKLVKENITQLELVNYD
jgi:DNA primase